MSRWIAYFLLAGSLIMGIHLAIRTQIFSSKTVVLRSLACTCPDYHVDLGRWNLKSPMLDTVNYLDRSEVYVTGVENHWNANSNTMFDFMIAHGQVVGVDRVSPGDPWKPVLEVTHWDHVGELTYPFRKWGAIFMLISGSFLLWLVSGNRING